MSNYDLCVHWPGHNFVIRNILVFIQRKLLHLKCCCAIYAKSYYPIMHIYDVYLYCTHTLIIVNIQDSLSNSSRAQVWPSVKVIALQEWEFMLARGIWRACETEVIKIRLLHCLYVTCTTGFVHVTPVAVYICMYLPPEDDLIGHWTGKSVQD